MTIKASLSKILAISGFFILLIFAAYPAIAQEATSSTSTKVSPQEKAGVKKQIIQDRISSLKENVASREAVLKAKLQTFRDKTKAQLAEKINTSLNRINKVQTDRMLAFLEKTTTLLNKLEARVKEGSPDIKDATAAKEAISDARGAIDAASVAVQAQALEDYTIQVTSETKIRQDAQAVRTKLHTDLQEVGGLVREAKQSVANAIRVAKSGSLPKEATNSGQ